MDIQDVVIIGGGMAGTISAFEIAKAGYRVVLLRDGWGASPHIAGFNLPGAEAGDSAACFLEDTLKSACGQADPVLAKILCEEAAGLDDYLKEIGFCLDTDESGNIKVRKSLGSSYARVVGKKNSTGADILAIVDALLRKKENVTVLNHTRALRLLANDGCVTGVLAYDKKREAFFTLHAPCVLMACGGYAGIYPFSSNTKDMAGDSVAMALLAGARAIDMEFVQFEPSGAVWPESIRGKGLITTLFYDGAIMTNALGERFMLRYSPEAERVNKDVLARCIAVELREGRGTARGGVYFDSRGVDPQKMHEIYGHFVKRYQNVGIDLLKEPVEVANAAHTSLGGIRVDENCQTNLKGLYAVGEAMGGLHGANRLGGSAGTETLVFSRRAARAICGVLKTASCREDVEEGPPPRLTRELSPARIEEIKRQMAFLLDRDAGVCREETGLRAAAEQLEQLYEEVRNASFGKDDRALFEKYSLENNLVTAVALVKSALLRDDSVGCHWRLDREAPPAVRYRTEALIKENRICVQKVNFK